jgi:23S rRNA pseudouridine1911/1915/1917 synthase
MVESPHPEEPTLHRLLMKLQPEIERGGLVHRLDRDTSGLLLAAKSASAQESLRSQFQEREVEKLYLALAEGVVEEDFEIEAPIRRNQSSGQERAQAMRIDLRGKEALTFGHPIETFKAATLLEVRIVTGRRHQIRAHLAYIGHPIVGDEDYGGAAGPGRPFLHATKLSFRHPEKGDRVDFSSPLPPELEGYLDLLRKEG